MIIALVIGAYFLIGIIVSIIMFFFTDYICESSSMMLATLIWPLFIISVFSLALFEFIFKVCKRIKEK